MRGARRRPTTIAASFGFQGIHGLGVVFVMRCFNPETLPGLACRLASDGYVSFACPGTWVASRGHDRGSLSDVQCAIPSVYAMWDGFRVLWPFNCAKCSSKRNFGWLTGKNSVEQSPEWIFALVIQSRDGPHIEIEKSIP